MAASFAAVVGPGVGQRVERVERLQRDPLGRRDGVDLPRQRVHHRPVPVDQVGHRRVGERGRDEHGAEPELGPQVAGDVAGGSGRTPGLQVVDDLADPRGCPRPSSSPTTRAPSPPSRISPGPMTSANRFTNAPTVRSRPIRRAISSSFRPFCSDTTNPSAASRGAIQSSAGPVACAFTASSTRSTGGRAVLGPG